MLEIGVGNNNKKRKIRMIYLTDGYNVTLQRSKMNKYFFFGMFTTCSLVTPIHSDFNDIKYHDEKDA